MSVQVVDSTTGTRLWSERYDRNLEAESVFDVQDDIADRAVATIADTNGVLIRAMAEPAMRKPAEALEPYEASLLMCVYSQHITPDEHLKVRTALEHAIERDPHDATCLANLAITRIDEYQHSMNVRPDAIETAVKLANAAVSVDPTNHLAYQAQAFASFCRRDIGAVLNAAERAVALNPRSSYALAHMGLLTAYCGEWERGVELVRRAIDLNPHHPGWYHFVTCHYHLHKGEYQEALAEAQRINMPGLYGTHVALGAAHSKLGNEEEARKAVEELLRLYPEFAEKGRRELEKWYGPGGMTQLLLAALREAGLDA